MKIGVQLPEIERHVGWNELWAMARLVEDGGLDSVWVGDHLLYHQDGDWRGPWEAWTTLSALAAVTERVELGPLVAATPFHPPGVIAKMAATVDEISGGRLILGLGVGWNRVEFEAFGLPFARRFERFEEAFTIIRTLLSQGAIDFHGEFYEATNCRLIPQAPTPGGPPLMIGSTGPRALTMTLPHVDLWNAWFDKFHNDPGEARSLMTRVDEIGERAGRDAPPVGKTLCVLFQFGDDSRRRSAVNPVVGEVHQLATLDAYRAMGVEHLQLVLDPITLDSIDRVVDVVGRWRRG